ncbi:MAG TPA: hypothetical protein VIX17_23605 [Pyrinomonadaceae bacterium]|jgi:hypothetical protein
MISLVLFCLLSIASVCGVSAQTSAPKESLKEPSIIGRWHVKFILIGGEEKNLDLIAKEHGVAVFELKDTGPDNKPVPTPQPGIWSMSDDKLSVSSNVELPIGTCCRENGTLIFKAKNVSSNSFSGKLIFVTNTDEEESPYKFRSTIGTFSATRLTKN